MSVKIVNKPKRNRLIRNLLILSSAFLINIIVINLLAPHVNTVAFASSVLPAIVGGWLYGRVRGFLIGVIAASVAGGFYLMMDLTSTPGHLFQALFGGLVIVLVGVAFGHLKELGLQSKMATQSRKDAEDTQRKLEKQLQQAQKMEAIGTLAGGVAHDMNNILGIIMSSASVLKQNLRGDEQNSDDVENILNACRRGRDLTRNLLGFARKGTYVKEILDINAIAEEATRLLAPALSKNIRLETDLDGNLYQIYGDRSQLEQAILNICINASEAIAARGTIRITTRNGREEDAPMIEEHDLYSEDFAIVEISDDGHGIDNQTLKHVFEPFYTTKSPGKGTGLGLSMAYGTMKNHGGGIEVLSKPGKGTRIIMMLPALVSEQRVKVQQRLTSTPPPSTTTGSILLVDDEPLIRTSNKRMLKQLGYEVMLAESGEHAIKIYKGYSSQIFLVILDFVMPGINGAETFERLKSINPDIKVLISSGYSKDGNIEAVLDNGALGFLQKPFDMEQLGDILRQMPKAEENRRQPRFAEQTSRSSFS